MTSTATKKQRVVSQAEWLAARKELLAKEKELTHMRDDIARRRRELPCVKIEKDYMFEGPNGKVKLADLFGGKSQLIVYHFMFGPDWQEGCPSCSFNMDHTDPALVHLSQRDVAFAVISRAPSPKIEAFKKRMGWRFPWVSSFGSDFNYDFHVSFSKEEKDKNDGKVYYNYQMMEFPSDEGPGFSAFYKDANGDVFHTYSAFARGSETTMNTYNYLDFAPKGRDEDGLPFTMAWVRHHDRYADGRLADADKPYWPKFASETR
jgi:predicted dithiol-disulfide oxidoreductase (DUF899 family)